MLTDRKLDSDSQICSKYCLGCYFSDCVSAKMFMLSKPFERCYEAFLLVLACPLLFGLAQIELAS